MKKRNNLFFLILSLFSMCFVVGGFFYKKMFLKTGFEKHIEDVSEISLNDSFDKNNLEYNFIKIVDSRFHYNQKLKEELFQFPLSGYKIYEQKKQKKFFIDNENDVIKNFLIHGNIWEEHIDNLMEKYVKPGSIVLDIGAHIGTHTINLSKYVQNGQVICFEPQPKLFSELFYNIIINKLHNVKIFNAAVGDGVGEIELSPLNHADEGSSTCKGNSGIIVPLLDIDSLNLKNVSLIKIDVEGMEDKVFEGAKKTIEENKPILIFEIHPKISVFDANLEQRKRIYGIYKKIGELGYLMQNISGHHYIGFPVNK